MGLIVRCFLSIFMGYISHALFHKPTMLFGKRWGQLLRYAIGYIGIMPLRQLFLDEGEKRIPEKVFTADIMSGVMYGTGVFMGYLADNEE